jgi:hypothetical protein
MPVGLMLAAVVGLGSATDAQNCSSSGTSARTAICAKIGTLGRFDSAKAGPIVDGAATIEVLYEPQYGTSFKQQSVTLLQVVGGEWRPLWSHVSEDSQFDPFSDAEDHTFFRWRYEAGGSRVRVTGSHTSRSKVRGSQRRRLAAESYCFTRLSRQFDRCPNSYRVGTGTSPR